VTPFARWARAWVWRARDRCRAGDALRGIGTGLGNRLDPGSDLEHRRTVTYQEAPETAAVTAGQPLAVEEVDRVVALGGKGVDDAVDDPTEPPTATEDQAGVPRRT
jgi:hypothetical protein